MHLVANSLVQYMISSPYRLNIYIQQSIILHILILQIKFKHIYSSEWQRKKSIILNNNEKNIIGLNDNDWILSQKKTGGVLSGSLPHHMKEDHHMGIHTIMEDGIGNLGLIFITFMVAL
ncbi:hypothetical protein ACJX0J_036792, partial [Zea mays]